MSGTRKPKIANKAKSKSSIKLKDSPPCLSQAEDSNDSLSDFPITKSKAEVTGNMNLKKEYTRYCKLYSSEPLEFVSAPLEQATMCQASGTSDIGGVTIDLKGRGLRGVDCIALGKILASNASIQHLNLSDCLLLPQGFQALLDGVSKNTHLEVFELRGNNIQFANMLEPLGTMLKVNSNLKSLIMEWNQIGCTKDAFQIFCDGLSINSGLEHLDLRNNQISDECAIELAAALKHNKVMRDLDLRWNSIGVKGARAFYDVLNINSTLTQVQLGGNFVPEEIVQHIDQILKQRNKQEEIVKDYSTRTTLLTRQLQKTEEEYQNEIKNIMSMFDAEEKEYRRVIEENQNQINRLSQERQEEVEKNSVLQNDVNGLRKQLGDSLEEVEMLRKSLTQKDDRLTELASSFKAQTGDLENTFDAKAHELQVLSESLSQEKTSLLMKLKTTEAELQLKKGEVEQLKDTITALNQTSEQLQKQFDERLRQAKESWTGFQTEVESAERKEIQRLESQMKDMNTSLMEHLKVLENKKADAEEEVRRMKMLLVTSKSETEEALAKLRAELAEEHNSAVKNHIEQITKLRQDNERLEIEVNRLESQVHKMEIENGKLHRQNDHLKQQLSQANEELCEAHASSQTVVCRTKTELKDTSERLSKEEEANRMLRSQLHDLQQQVATLSVKVTKLSQEKQADMDFWKLQIQRREDELNRLKSEDMRRAALLHEAFSVYMRGTAAATGLPIPSPFCGDYTGQKTKTAPEKKQKSARQQPEKPKEN
ncbi:Leucine-rich repeat-containing protein 45 [Orchesella cincta]|uniref:Leucine-rich repeat-containing protein 45 n=1 Tax=Orchesella cincta TaxID=48709 RepID=A0A1D2MYC4_ORCCI|nr:Leucine-rich repeat-containing protein 45 [Orchesella cincta]